MEMAEQIVRNILKCKTFIYFQNAMLSGAVFLITAVRLVCTETLPLGTGDCCLQSFDIFQMQRQRIQICIE